MVWSLKLTLNRPKQFKTLKYCTISCQISFRLVTKDSMSLFVHFKDAIEFDHCGTSWLGMSSYLC